MPKPYIVGANPIIVFLEVRPCNQFLYYSNIINYLDKTFSSQNNSLSLFYFLCFQETFQIAHLPIL